MLVTLPWRHADSGGRPGPRLNDGLERPGPTGRTSTGAAAGTLLRADATSIPVYQRGRACRWSAAYRRRSFEGPEVERRSSGGAVGSCDGSGPPPRPTQWSPAAAGGRTSGLGPTGAAGPSGPRRTLRAVRAADRRGLRWSKRSLGRLLNRHPVSPTTRPATPAPARGLRAGEQSAAG